MLTVLLHFSVGTDIRLFTVVPAVREEFLESKDCDQFEETEEGMHRIPFSLL